MEKRVSALAELCYRNRKLRSSQQFNLLNTGILNLWLIAFRSFKVVMYFSRASYHPIWSSTDQPPYSCSQVITFWAFGDWPTFVATYSILKSHNHNLCLFFGVQNWLLFPVSGGKRQPLAKMDSLNHCNVHLMTAANKVIKKIRHFWLVNNQHDLWP